ncbi:MAG TPA: TfoX/Sxy family protein [Alphaproteobacteria bacterium]|jgi:DNA transformation protein|nr:TfoX/Sxy family protein [Alphaproteobacteria bacterium]
MAVSPDFLDHLLDQFAGFGAVDARRMFSGVGLFRDGLMIALVTGDTLYFKTDDANRGDFEAAGMTPFGFDRQGRRMITSYFEAPAEVFDDPEVLVRWARSAYQAASRADRARGGRSAAKRAKPRQRPARAKAKPAAKRARPKPKAKTARKSRRPARRRR